MWVFYSYAGLIIMFGLILIGGKKFMIRCMYERAFLAFSPMFLMGMNYMRLGFRLSDLDRGIFALSAIFFLLSLLFFSLSILLFRGRYTIYNANNEMITSLLGTILEERNIEYEKKTDSLLLNEGEAKHIYYKQSLNTVEVNLKDIKELPYYEELKDELKTRIKEIDNKIISYTGLYNIGIGIVAIAMVRYLSKA